MKGRFLLFLVSLFTYGAWGASETSTTALPTQETGFEVRVRPFAAFDAIPGLETGFELSDRIEVGPSVHYFTSDNDIRGSAVTVWEAGIKSNFLVWRRLPREGIYVSFAVYDDISEVEQFVSPQLTLNTGFFNSFAETFTAGYQWNLRWFQSDAWTVRLGAGVGYKPEHIQSFNVNGVATPVGVRERLDPTLEFSLGAYLF